MASHLGTCHRTRGHAGVLTCAPLAPCSPTGPGCPGPPWLPCERREERGRGQPPVLRSHLEEGTGSRPSCSGGSEVTPQLQGEALDTQSQLPLGTLSIDCPSHLTFSSRRLPDMKLFQLTPVSQRQLRGRATQASKRAPRQETPRTQPPASFPFPPPPPTVPIATFILIIILTGSS